MTKRRQSPPVPDAVTPGTASRPAGYEDKMLRPVRHGWVTPLPGGVRARCGGPGSCPVCKEERIELSRRREQLKKQFESLGR